MSRSRLKLLLLLPLLLAGCGREPLWHGRNLQHVMPDLSFTLTDHHGLAVNAADYRGKVVLLYFGFAHCSSACPTTLATLTSAVRRLGDQASQVAILFVSVDPQRDTPEVLHHHAEHFSPYVSALTGSARQLAALAKRYRVTYSFGVPDANGNYEVYHSSAIFVFDGQGQIRLLHKEPLGAAAIAEDLQRLLGAGAK